MGLDASLLKRISGHITKLEVNGIGDVDCFKELIEKGWSKSVELNAQVKLLRPLFENPAENFFMDKSHLSSADSPLIIFFAKLYLFNRISFEYSKRPELKNNDDKWFVDTREMLEVKLGELRSKDNVDQKDLKKLSESYLYYRSRAYFYSKCSLSFTLLGFLFKHSSVRSASFLFAALLLLPAAYQSARTMWTGGTLFQGRKKEEFEGLLKNVRLAAPMRGNSI